MLVVSLLIRECGSPGVPLESKTGLRSVFVRRYSGQNSLEPLPIIERMKVVMVPVLLPIDSDFLS